MFQYSEHGFLSNLNIIPTQLNDELISMSFPQYATNE